MIRALQLRRPVDHPLEFASAFAERRAVEQSLRRNADAAENQARRPGGQKCSGTRT
jgi:hypothetical protein